MVVQQRHGLVAIEVGLRDRYFGQLMRICQVVSRMGWGSELPQSVSCYCDCASTRPQAQLRGVRICTKEKSEEVASLESIDETFLYDRRK